MPGLMNADVKRTRSEWCVSVVMACFLMALCFAVPASAQTTSQIRYPSNCSSQNRAGDGSEDWSNASNATSNDGNVATVVLDGQTSRTLLCNNYGFSIPSDATITGIVVYVDRASSRLQNGGSRDVQVQLAKNNVIGGANLASPDSYPTSLTVTRYGTDAYLWGNTWMPADINSSNFGVGFVAAKPDGSGQPHTVSVNYIAIEVFYTISQPPTLPCTPPSTPAGIALNCVCDNFGRASLNPSTIFGGDWTLSNSDGFGNAYINGTTGLLRLTENTNNNAKAATVPGTFPAAGNYISVEFYHYAYNGTNPGADGIAITLSDSAFAPVPGGFGGSLGYAPRNDGNNPPGFAGGWLGIALDEYGNYLNPTEGRTLGSGFQPQTIGARGPGSGANGYRAFSNSITRPGNLNLDNIFSAAPAPGYLYQVIVDARNSNSGTVNVQVNRDATNRDGSTYQTLLGPFNAYPEAAYALSQGWISQAVPNFWRISFTGSTGGSRNIHEIGGLRICAQAVIPPSGATASGFSAIDEAYPAASGTTVPAYADFQNGDIYTKLTGVPFRLWVAALGTNALETNYSATADRHVQLTLVDNTDGACGSEGARNCAACANKPPAETGARQTVTFNSTSNGAVLSSPITMNSAWRHLVAVMRECTTSACTSFTPATPACSVDAFSVRPLEVSTVTTTNATNVGKPEQVFRAGADNFNLTATVSGTNNSPSRYTGTLKIDNAAVAPVAPATVAGTINPTQFPAAQAPAGQPNAVVNVATGSNFTYNEVGAFRLIGANPALNATGRRAIYDGVISALECAGLSEAQCNVVRGPTWTGIDSTDDDGPAGNQADCVRDSFSNLKDASGRYGCNFGLRDILAYSDPAQAGYSTQQFTRFIPFKFALTGTLENRADIQACIAGSDYTYIGEQLNAVLTLTAQAAGGATTLNYANSLARLDPTQFGNLQLAAIDRTVTPAYRPTLNNTGLPGITASDASGNALPANCGSSAQSCFRAGVARLSVPFRAVREAAPGGPYPNVNIGVAPIDSDGVTVDFDMDSITSAGTTFDRGKVGTTEVRYGRLQIDNAYGSELLPLNVGVRAQYWNGTAYTPNLDDSCTPLGSGNFSLSNYSGGLIGSTVSVQNPTPTPSLATSTGSIRLSKPTPTPTARGSVRLNSALPYLPGSGRVTFGVYRTDTVIYTRELF